jgi:hypothetical protein
VLSGVQPTGSLHLGNYLGVGGWVGGWQYALCDGGGVVTMIELI